MKRVLLTSVSAILLLQSGVGATLIRLDFQNNGNWGPYPGLPQPNGVESNAAAANSAFGHLGLDVWDVRGIPVLGTWTSNPTFPSLLDTETGAATGVSLSFTGSISSAADGPAVAGDRLQNDYFLLLAGHAPNSATYALSGLPPSTSIILYPYAARLAAYGDSRRVSLSANGVGPFDVGHSGQLINCVSDALGQVTGAWAIPAGLNESNFSGLQIYIAPEPASIAALLGTILICRRSHR